MSCKNCGAVAIDNVLCPECLLEVTEDKDALDPFDNLEIDVDDSETKE